MKGFKSFAERTQLKLDPELTIVVGPNGSGKSNIIEAIRWVLGEQSVKNLRGHKMPDIIFAGSDHKRAANRAEVTLTFDNSDHHLPYEFTELSVTRRYYRSGESEYYINQHKCRLKDITELFLDSGLGKESFSIISQGNIEALFSHKSEERRKIIEEAAGVLKYKQRKKEAEQKVQETQENLIRIQDILFELSKQIEPLCAEKEQALTYQHLLNEEQQLGIMYQLTLIDQILAYITQQETELYQQEIEFISEQKARAEIEQKYHVLQEKLDQLRTSLQQLQQKQQEVSHQHMTCSHDMDMYQLLKNQKETEMLKKQAELMQIQEKQSQLQEHLNTVIEEQRIAKEQEQAYQKEHEQLISQQQALEEDVDVLLEQLRNDYIDLMQEEAVLHNEQKNRRKLIEQYETRQEHLIHDQTVVQGQYEQQTQALLDLQSHQKIKQDQFNKLNEEKITITQSLTELNRHYDSLTQQRLGLQQKRQKYDYQKDYLSKMLTNYSGFYQGVQAILKVKERWPAFVGVLIDLIQVPKDYILAIETALGAQAQYIIMREHQAAQEAIQFLKKNRLGRATFLPLDRLSVPLRTEEEERLPSQYEACLGWADTLIDYPKEIHLAIQQGLGKTLVAKNLSDATVLAKAIGYRYRIISLEGDVISRGGAMTGGAVKKKNQTSLLQQKEELQEVIKALQTLDQDVQFFEEEEQTYQLKIQKIQEQLMNIQEQMNQIDSDLYQVTLDEQSLIAQVKELEQKREQLKQGCERQVQELASLTQEYQTSEALQQQLAVQKQEIEAKRTALMQRSMTQQEQKEKLQEQMTHLQMQQVSQQQKIEYISKQYDTYLGQVNELTQTEKQIDIDIHTLNQEFNTLTEQLNSGKKLQEQLKMQLTQLTEQIQLKEKEESVLQEELTMTQQNFEKVDKRYEQIKASYQQLQLEVQDATRKGVQAKQMLEEQYECTYESLKEHVRASDLARVKEHYQICQKERKALEPVNMLAIEQYDQLIERYEFLTQQQNDLLLSIETLTQTMEELDRKVSVQFKDTFDEINHAFSQTFQELFGGGQASLKLSDPKALLTTGIDIEAQPPGKKVTNLQLLSGGEKSLTVLALLFAMIRVRPIPFCILDEVEAALDEVNVLRFSQFLKQLKSETQFLVITHRQGTMEAATVLYGVTMEQSGVSKIISAQVKEVQDQEPFYET